MCSTTMTHNTEGAIGATAGFAMAQAAMAVPASATATEMEQAMNEAAVVVEAARPTAQNLFFAVRTVKAAALETLGPGGGGISDGLHDRFVKAAVSSAQAIADDDAACCKAIGEHGAVLFEMHGHRVSTHCNAGWLAFVDWGSALSPIFVANAQASTSNSKQKPFVWVDETRPRYGYGTKNAAHCFIGSFSLLSWTGFDVYARTAYIHYTFERVLFPFAGGV